MKINFLFIFFIAAVTLSASVPSGLYKRSDGLVQALDIDSAIDDLTTSESTEASATGVSKILNKGKQTLKLVKVLKDCLKTLRQIDIIQNGGNLSKDVKGPSKKFIEKGKGFFKSGIFKRDLVDDLLAKVFIALKKSGLVNSIIKMAVTDDEVRPAVVDIIIDLIEADVIPYTEICLALRESGLARDVTKSFLTDPETRTGAIELIKELIPDLLKSGAIKPSEILRIGPFSPLSASDVAHSNGNSSHPTDSEHSYTK